MGLTGESHNEASPGNTTTVPVCSVIVFGVGLQCPVVHVPLGDSGPSNDAAQCLTDKVRPFRFCPPSRFVLSSDKQEKHPGRCDELPSRAAKNRRSEEIQLVVVARRSSGQQFGGRSRRRSIPRMLAWKDELAGWCARLLVSGLPELRRHAPIRRANFQRLRPIPQRPERLDRLGEVYETESPSRCRCPIPKRKKVLAVC